MKKLVLFMIVMMLALVGCQSQPSQPVAATPTLAFTPGPDVKPVVDSNFKDPSDPLCEAWTEDWGESSCHDGELHLISKQSGGETMTTPGLNLQNFIIQARVRMEGNQGAYGLAIRNQNGKGRSYNFIVNAEGKYQLVNFAFDRPVIVLIPWTASPAIHPGQEMNELEVIAQDTRLTLFANGQQLASVSDDTFKSGDAAPVAVDEGHAVASTMKIWELPSAQLALATQSVGSQSHFKVITPSVEDETDLVWSTLQDMEFMDKFGYAQYLTWPDDPAIKELIQKGRDKKLQDADYATLQKLMKKLYHPEDYEKSYQKVAASFATLEQAIPTFQKFNTQWGFKVFDNYTVLLTFYGTGGSYNADSGEIIMWTTKEGGVVDRDPTEIILHESVHIGIEDLIQTFTLDQRIKERIVDKFVLDNFISLVPNYQPQPAEFVDTSIDKYLEGEAAWDNLPERIKEYMSNK